MKKNVNLILILLIASIVGFTAIAGNILRLDISSYQGIHPEFVSVYYNGKYYTSEQTYDASSCRIFSTSLNFDPDHANYYKPNLMGGLRDIQIVRDLSYYVPSDTLTHIIQMGGNPQPNNPYKTYTWDVKLQDGTTEKYEMQLWLCTFDVNLYVKADRPTSLLAWPGSPEVANSRYKDTEVWLKLKVGPSWYIKGAEEVFFGLAYMELAQFTSLSEGDRSLDALPKAKWEAFSMCDRLGNLKSTSQLTPTEQVEKIYKGCRLNENVFKDEWYTLITLTNFGTYDYNWFDGSYKADSAQWRALVHVFVVGKWVVKPEEERDMEPHEPPEGEGWFVNLLNALSGFFSSPLGFFSLLLIGGIVILIVIILSGYLPMILVYLGSRRT